MTNKKIRTFHTTRQQIICKFGFRIYSNADKNVLSSAVEREELYVCY
jgi:hypothetical protein